MTKAIIGRKIGMTQIFDEATNKVIPLTVVESFRRKLLRTTATAQYSSASAT